MNMSWNEILEYGFKYVINTDIDKYLLDNGFKYSDENRSLLKIIGEDETTIKIEEDKVTYDSLELVEELVVYFTDGEKDTMTNSIDTFKSIMINIIQDAYLIANRMCGCSKCIYNKQGICHLCGSCHDYCNFRSIRAFRCEEI